MRNRIIVCGSRLVKAGRGAGSSRAGGRSSPPPPARPFLLGDACEHRQYSDQSNALSSTCSGGNSSRIGKAVLPDFSSRHLSPVPWALSLLEVPARVRRRLGQEALAAPAHCSVPA